MWLANQLQEQFGEKSSDDISKLEQSVLECLGKDKLGRDCEKKLLALLGHKKFTFVRVLLK
jgi:hypothetical protein